jgi:hypothetical protein
LSFPWRTCCRLAQESGGSFSFAVDLVAALLAIAVLKPSENDKWRRANERLLGVSGGTHDSAKKQFRESGKQESNFSIAERRLARIPFFEAGIWDYLDRPVDLNSIMRVNRLDRV